VLCELIPGGASKHIIAGQAEQILAAVAPADAVPPGRLLTDLREHGFQRSDRWPRDVGPVADAGADGRPSGRLRLAMLAAGVVSGAIDEFLDGQVLCHRVYPLSVMAPASAALAADRRLFTVPSGT
jgi:hypothetical protein